MYPEIKTLLIDLDDTVYPTSLGVWPFLMQRIYHYMHEVVGIPADMVEQTRDRMYETYGTTLRGLMAENDVEMQDYLDYVHIVDLSDYIKPDPELRESLLSIDIPKWIFTNASRAHAENVLGLLEIRDLFTGIVDVIDTTPWCKPQQGAYDIVLQHVGSPEPKTCLFIDDRASNLDTARQIGLRTLQVMPTPDSSHPAISQLADLPFFLANASPNSP